ncbi:protein-L-isoaspartate(D-aspartate) O-methyltransferase [Candidatus Poribacteria bacterium]
MKDYDVSRKRMVEEQIASRDVKDSRVLDVMLKMPRHVFVSEEFQDLAYSDQPLPVGEGQTISQPYMVALMTELLHLSGDDRVLEIGTGSGYQTAILAELAGEVYTVEIVESLMERSTKLLHELGYRNIKFKTDDGYFGWEEYAPFDVILVTCGPDSIPQPLVDQLAEGGCLVIPVGSMYQVLTIVEKVKGKIKTHKSISCRFVPMLGQH